MVFPDEEAKRAKEALKREAQAAVGEPVAIAEVDNSTQIPVVAQREEPRPSEVRSTTLTAPKL
jgi:hypothetical protein